MKNLIALIALFAMVTTSGCSSTDTFLQLSENIYKINGGKNDKSTFKLSSYERDARVKAYFLDRSSFLKGNLKDTLFILEGYNIETAAFYGAIWTKNHQVTYSYSNGTFTLQKQSVFTDYQITLVTNWDTLQIKKEKQANGKWLDNYLLINGVRCCRNGGKWTIDEVYFKNFFNIKRDK